MFVGLPSGLGTKICLLSVVAGLFHFSGHKMTKIQILVTYTRQRTFCVVICEVITALPVDSDCILQPR